VERSAKRFGAAIGIVLVLFAIVVRVSRPSKAVPGPVASSSPGEPTPTPTPVPGKGRPALVFFVDPEGNGLVARRTEVTPHADPSLQAKAILDATIAGPAFLPAPKPGELALPSLPSVPPGVTVRAVFFDGKGTAIVDLAGLRERLAGGSDAEILALWSVVDALAFNFPVDARRVRVLLDGQSDVLLHHVSLAAPLTPRRDLVIGDVPSLAIPVAGGQVLEPEQEEDGPSPFDDLVPTP
jgi:hypothetical protein